MRLSRAWIGHRPQLTPSAAAPNYLVEGHEGARWRRGDNGRYTSCYKAAQNACASVAPGRLTSASTIPWPGQPSIRQNQKPSGPWIAYGSNAPFRASMNKIDHTSGRTCASVARLVGDQQSTRVLQRARPQYDRDQRRSAAWLLGGLRVCACVWVALQSCWTPRDAVRARAQYVYG
jgi:hypothetical protein